MGEKSEGGRGGGRPPPSTTPGVWTPPNTSPGTHQDLPDGGVGGDGPDVVRGQPEEEPHHLLFDPWEESDGGEAFGGRNPGCGMMERFG